jgi:autotransporter-associated beta strand protein
VILNGNGISFDDHNLGALRNISGDNTFTGNVIVNLPPAEAVQSVTIEADSGSEMIMEGAISGGGVGFTLVKEGTGTVTFDNTSPNTYTGTTAIYQGALQAQTSTAFSSGAVEVLDGAQVQLQTPTGGSSVNIANPLLLSGTGINNTGALLNTGGSNTWSGSITFEILPGFAPLTLTQGTVAIGADVGTTLTLSGEIDEEPSAATGIPNGLLPMGLLKVGAGTVALSNSNHYSGSTEVAQGILDVQNSAALGDRITAGGLETIEQIVTLSNTGADGLGTGEFTLSFDGKTATASKLNFGASSSAVQNVLEGVGGGGGLFASAGLVGASVHVFRTAVQTTTENGPSAVSPASDVTGWVYTLIFGGSLAQTPLQVEAIGTLGTLASTNVVAAGGVDVLVDNTVKGTGELELDNSALLPAGTGLVVPNYTLTLNGSGPTGNGALYNLVGDNTWSGPVILAANDSLPSTKHTLDAVGVAAPTTTNPDISLSLTDVQSVSTQVGSLVPLVPELDKVGPGTLIFPFGATYTAETTFSTGDTATALGTTLISAGNVQVDAGTEAASFGAILLGGGTVSGNGTGTLSGNNIVGGVVSSINNATSAAGGGTIDPGDNYPNEASGQITSSGNVNLNSNDTVFVNLGLPTNMLLPPSTSNNNDIFDVAGTINLNGATLTGLVNVDVVIGDSYTIINAGSVVGEFNGSSVTPTESGATAATIGYIGGVKFEVDYFSNRVDVIRELVHETMTLTPSLASPAYGQDEQFIATLTSTDPSTPTSQPPLATGTVVFTVTNPLGAVSTYDVTLPTSPATGVAILDLPSILDAPLMEGGLGYTVTATYSGIDANGNATFTPIPTPPAPPPSTSVTISPENTATTLSLAYPLPEVYGETFTIVASVATTLTSPVAKTLAPAGSVSFYDGANLLATVALTSPLPGTTTATATLVSTALSNLVTAGNHTITAVYNESLTPENYLTSSGTVGLSIHQAATTVTVTTPPLSPAPVYGQAGVTFTAVVAPVSPASGNPTGTVTFEDGSLILGSGTLSTAGGVTTATYTTTAGQLLVGNPSQISAIYPGDINFTGNTGTLAEVVKQANTAMTLSSSAPSPPGAPDGQSVTFTATVAAVSPGGGNPTGVVTFKNGSTILGLGALSTSGGVTTATFTISAYQLPVGISTITASYPGDTNFIGSSSTLSQTITQSLSTTTVNTSGASVYGQPVTFTATVKPTVVGGPIPTGTVTFYVTVNSSLVQLGSGTLGTTGGATTASYTTTVGQLPVATNETITAVYSGNSQYTTSTGTTSQTVSKDSTSVILTSSGSITPSESVTFTAQVVANSPGGGNPTSSVSFMAGSTLLGTANLTTLNGVTTAQITVPGSELMVGANAITATYGGDGNFLGSNGSMSEVVEEGTTTTVTSSPSPSVYGQSVMLTATITPSVPLATSPTGTVTFTIGSTTLGSATVGTAGGLSTAILILSNLPVGSNQTIVASYSGDGTFIGSSGSVSQTVNKTQTKTTLSSTATSIELGQPVIFTVQVSPVAPGGGIPTGTVTFKNGATAIATVPLIGGVATFQKTLGLVGKDSITAVYSGDANDLSSKSAPVVVTVAAVGIRHSKVTVTSSVNPSVFGQAVTFTATIKDAGTGAVHTPVGTADFFDGTTLLGYGTLSTTAGVTTATFTTSTLPLGSNSITAAYNGNATFAHSVSAAITQTVNAAPIRPSVITLSSSSLTSTFGVPVTFSATVTDEGSGAAQTPTGTVTFTATNTTTNAVFNMGSGTLSGSNGIATTSISFATLPTDNLPAGYTYNITATYSGDGSFFQESNLTAALTHKVTQGTTAVSLASSLPDGSVYGQAVTFTATVSIPGSNVVPVGAVDIKNQTTGVDYGTFTLNGSGVATVKTSALITGDDNIVATYTGSSNSGSSSASLDQTVNQAATKMTLTSTSTSNTPVTMTATVTAVAPGAGIPTGTASFYIDSLFVGIAVVNSNGVVTLTDNTGVSTGTHTIEVVYSGDNNFLGSEITKVVKFVVGRGT